MDSAPRLQLEADRRCEWGWDPAGARC